MCGMRRSADVQHAVALGVDAIGLIFYEGSSRYITVENAREMLREVPAFVGRVAVFVNPDSAFVFHVLEVLPIEFLQFHGDETRAFCEQFGRPYIKAIPATSSTHIVKASIEYQSASALLLDTPSTTQRGGSGKTFDWNNVPVLDMPVILSGGLHPENIQEAVKRCSPYAVDVCSGIESSPGIKNFEKMNEFVEALWGRG